ncbi:MAG TPA: S46 family peptidase [Bacteroidales bacterium]|nr:S46 family peptidase [Bacteroidales bacterium]
MRRLTEKVLIAIAFSILSFQALNAQSTPCDKPAEAGVYDMGKMWTFDYAPVEYFRNTYNFTPDAKWFEEARLSALRFANYCSASFVSADGLVMTNHHCARASGFEVQRPGENFNENGFYAQKLADERKVKDLYVDQLAKIEDITDRVIAATSKETTEAGQLAMRDKVFGDIKKEYSEKPEWKGLELQTIQFYNGGKYSLYGFKRYTDVRLVFMPELNLGFFGGDYDNFTYPRYALDCSFFRVYDENGKPLKTDHYFKFSANGASEGEPVFVIGNPGTTLRLSTISDLEFRRDVQLPLALEQLKKVSLIYQAYNEKAKKDSIINIIFGLENSWKATNGELEGLKDPCVMARKGDFEAKFRNDVKNKTSLNSNLWVWDEIEKTNKELRTIYNEYSILGSGGRFAGQLLQFAQGAVTLNSSFIDPSRKDVFKKRVADMPVPKEMELEQHILAFHLQFALDKLGSEHPYVKAALNGKTPAEAAAEIIKNTRLADAKFRAELLTKDSAALWNVNDPLLNLAKISMPRYNGLSVSYKELQSKLFAYRSKIGRMLFDLYGTQIPPDATFSLRINDGVVKGYEYNGTIAPPFTTFFGLYDRYYSFSKKYPFSLPKRWENPPAELLKTPMNFASTNDIIGGNSGSPMVNKNLEVIGLVFDGNIESLPGRFIFIPDQNRAVGVHSGGMLAALKYIYKANRLVTELTAKK